LGKKQKGMGWTIKLKEVNEYLKRLNSKGQGGFSEDSKERRFFREKRDKSKNMGGVLRGIPVGGE